MKPSLVGAIEAGGTKFVCAIGTDPQNIEERNKMWAVYVGLCRRTNERL